MLRFKIWLMCFSIALILVNKFSVINTFRDYITVFIQKQTQNVLAKLKSYPQLVLLQKQQQKSLEQENIKLKQQVEHYSILLKQQTNYDTNLKSVQNLQDNFYEHFTTIITRAIIDINYLVNNKLLIDKGNLDKINLGNAVVNKDGVIGQVSSINQKNSQVTLITHPEYKIYLQTKVSKSKMLAQGIGNNNMLVKYINKNENIKPNDLLFTTGLDNIFPANIPVAKVIKVFNENNGFNSAMCEPIVNFNSLQYILVLKNE